MRRPLLFVLLMLCLLGTPQAANAVADPDPQIGQPAVGYRISVTKYDNVSANSVLQECGSASKFFFVTAKIKRGTPGNFIQAASSSARFKATTGEVMTSPAYRSVSKRRIAFMMSSSIPSGDTMIDKSARNTLTLATNDPRAKIVLRGVSANCIFYG